MSISWPAKKTNPKALEDRARSELDSARHAEAVVPMRTSRKRKRSVDATEELLRVRSEIERDLNIACPEYSEFVTSLRRFASGRLSSLSNQVLGVVSARGGEGRTTVALALAAALSEMHQKVIYVECDSGDSSNLLSQMGEARVEGLSEWLGGDSNLNAAIYETGAGQLFVLPYGKTAVRSTPLETVSRMRILFDRLRGMFDVVVVDMPAVLTNEGTPALMKELDNILLVVGANQTTSAEVEETVRLCGYIPVSGIFLNKLTYSAPEWIMSLVSPGLGRVTP